MFTEFYMHFFIERTSKGIWFFLPMGIAVLFNAGLFTSIAYTLYKVYGSLRQFKLQEKKDGKAEK